MCGHLEGVKDRTQCPGQQGDVHGPGSMWEMLWPQLAHGRFFSYSCLATHTYTNRLAPKPFLHPELLTPKPSAL